MGMSVAISGFLARKWIKPQAQPQPGTHGGIWRTPLPPPAPQGTRSCRERFSGCGGRSRSTRGRPQNIPLGSGENERGPCGRRSVMSGHRSYSYCCEISGTARNDPFQQMLWAWLCMRVIRFHLRVAMQARSNSTHAPATSRGHTNCQTFAVATLSLISTDSFVLFHLLPF